MSFPRQQSFRRRERDRNRVSRPEFFDRQPEMHDLIHPEHTGAEAEHLKSLVDSRAKVTVVLKTGEHLQGRIRYYDRHCFSLGLSAHGPRLFIRKESVSHISEDQPAVEIRPPQVTDPGAEFS